MNFNAFSDITVRVDSISIKSAYLVPWSCVLDLGVYEGSQKYMGKFWLYWADRLLLRGQKL